MKRNQYLEAQEVDRVSERMPWDESEFSKALGAREKTLLRQDRVSTILLMISTCLILGAGVFGVVCRRGRNPTLRLWPAIFSGEIDVFPSERRNMGQEIGR